MTKAITEAVVRLIEERYNKAIERANAIRDKQLEIADSDYAFDVGCAKQERDKLLGVETE